MKLNDPQLAFLNSITFTLSFTAVNESLQLILLIVSIAYTVKKIFNRNKKNE